MSIDGKQYDIAITGGDPNNSYATLRFVDQDDEQHGTLQMNYDGLVDLPLLHYTTSIFMTYC